MNTLEIKQFWRDFGEHPFPPPGDGTITITTLPSDSSSTISIVEDKEVRDVSGQGNGLKNEQTAIKFDNGKTDWSLMPFEAIEEINKVLEFGAKKYAAHNWTTGDGFRYTRVLNSLFRHLFAWSRGEDLDPESGLSHLAHAGCNIIFLLYYNRYKSRYNNDDRFKR